MIQPGVEEARLSALEALGVLDTPPEERFDRVTNLCTRLFGVPMAAVALVDRERWFAKSLQGLSDRELPRTQAFCDYTIRQPDTFLVEDMREDPRFAANSLVTDDPHIRFYAGYPLEAPGGHRVGTLCLMDTAPRRLSEGDRALLRDLASWVQKELAIDEELKRAAEIQRGLLPSRPPGLAGYDVAGCCLPSLEVGGDLYDWYPVPGGIALTVADVMGKGMPAAIVMATLRAMLRAGTRQGDVVAGIGLAASALEADFEEAAVFATVFHAVLSAGDGVVRYVDAGHGLARTVTARGAVVSPDARGVPAGAVSGAVWPEGRFDLAPGDTFVLFSDGVLDLHPDQAAVDAAVAEAAAAPTARRPARRPRPRSPPGRRRHRPRRAPPAVRPADLRAALALVAGLLVASGSAAAAQTTQPTHPADGDGGAAPISAYGYGETPLRGMFGRADLFFVIPPGARPAGDAALTLDFSHSPLLRPQSTLTVVAGDVSVASVFLTGENANRGRLAATVPADLIGRNGLAVSVRSYMRLTNEECEEPDNPALWATVHRSSTVQFATEATERSLEDAAALITGPDGRRTVRLGLAADPGPDELKAAGAAAAQVGRWQAARHADAQVTLAGADPSLAPTVVVAAGGDTPAGFPVTWSGQGYQAQPGGTTVGGHAGLVALAQTGPPAVLVGGDTPAAASRAAEQLGARLSGPVVSLDGPAPARPNPASEPWRRGAASFAQLGVDRREVNGIGPASWRSPSTARRDGPSAATLRSISSSRRGRGSTVTARPCRWRWRASIWAAPASSRGANRPPTASTSRPVCSTAASTAAPCAPSTSPSASASWSPTARASPSTPTRPGPQCCPRPPSACPTATATARSWAASPTPSPTTTRPG